MENICDCCGDIIPESRQICWICEHKDDDKEPVEWDGSGD